MRSFITPKTLKKQTKVLLKNWPNSINSVEIRKILTTLYGYKTPHHYTKVSKLKDGSYCKITQPFLLQNLEYFTKRLALLGDISDSLALKMLKLLYPNYIPAKGYFPHYATIQFFGDLNHFLFKDQRDTPLKYGFNGFPAIKDGIEALGIPHPEVASIIVDGKNVDFNYNLKPDQKVLVYPFNYKNVKPTYQIAPKNIKFILDVHLGTLAKFLRMAGFDSFYQNRDLGDKKLAQFSSEEDRILLTRDIGLLKRGEVNYGYWVRETDPEIQFKEIIKRYNLVDKFKSFTRCISCNGELIETDFETVENDLKTPDNITKEFDHFKQCSRCKKIYWKGSHYENMEVFLEKIENEIKFDNKNI